MRSLIMANGEYGDSDWYRQRAQKYELVICADGGANKARELDIIPDMIVGDMDSIEEKQRSSMERDGVKFCAFSSEKDFTDTQLAMDIAEKTGTKSILVWGGIGSRLDHSLANILSAVSFAKKGIHIQFESPTLTVYLVIDNLTIEGNIGDTVSVLALGERASGVSLKGFKYPLDEVILDANLPIGVSNILMKTEANIKVNSGVLAVFHNH